MDIFENGTTIGTVQAEPEGLYTRLTCKTEPSRTIRRLYLAYPYASVYLGIPDENGVLSRRVASKKLPEQFLAVSSQRTHAGYLPWCGAIDSIAVHDALIGPSEILISLDDAMNFPSWSLETKTVDDIQMAVIPLNAEGVPQPKEREATYEALDFSDIDPDVFDVVPADDIGGEPEADRPDL